MTNNKEWVNVCEVYCARIGAELLFVNDYDFGYEKNGNLVHLDAEELATRLLLENIERSSAYEDYD